MDEEKHLAGRVFQLESHNLDNELNNSIDRWIDELDLTKFNEELKVVLKLYLYMNHIKQNATSGMQVYKLNFNDISFDRHGRSKPSKHKLVMLAACNIMSSYISNKYQQLDRLLERSCFNKLKLPWIKLDLFIHIFKSLSVLNFMIFLGTGRYPTLKERLLGIGPVILDRDYSASSAINKIQADYMYRETIWKVLAEFLTTMIPLVNPTQVKNHLFRFIGCMPKMDKEVTLSEKIKRESNDYKCAICEKQPFNPYVIGCRHVFCYYCLYSNHLSDPTGGFVCNHCKYSTHDSSEVLRYRKLQL